MSSNVWVKKTLGKSAAKFLPQCQYKNCVFLIGHMRCGSTALSNIICSRDEFSGYGEAHITYQDHSGPGMLAINQLKKKVWNPKAAFLYDKILHNPLDAKAPDDFFKATLIFMVRQPAATIPSILNLFQKIGSDQYRTYEQAADYYITRLKQMTIMRDKTPTTNICTIHYEDILESPDTYLLKISTILGLKNPLKNKYDLNQLTKKKGVGDPLNAHKHNAIVQTTIKKEPSKLENKSDTEYLQRAEEVYKIFLNSTHRTNEGL